MRCALLVSIVLLALTSCEEQSSYESGMRDAVRYQLPRGMFGTLEHADDIEVLALGDPPQNGSPATSTRLGLFDGRPVLSVVRVPREWRGALVSALYESIGSEYTSLCFMPHHGIRVRRDRAVIELSVCFECGKVELLGPRRVSIDIYSQPLSGVLDTVFLALANMRFVDGRGSETRAWQTIDD